MSPKQQHQQLPSNTKQKTQLTTFLRRPTAAHPSSQLTSDPFEPLPRSFRGSPAPPPAAPRLLAVDIPISKLRPIAFRVFTKKHNLTLKSDALVLLCQFIGRHCGAEWRDSGSGDKMLDEVARRWKRAEAPGKLLVDGGETLKSVLKGMDVPAAAASPAVSRPPPSSFGMGMGSEIPSSMLMAGEATDVQMSEEVREEIEDNVDPREYLTIVDAFDQPRTIYNTNKKMFERYLTGPPEYIFPG